MATELTAERLAELRERDRMLQEFASDFRLDGDQLVCVHCERRCVGAREDEDFVHAPDCAARTVGGRPWVRLCNLLLMPIDLPALLRAAEERDKARADLHALRTALVEATMEPFDIGPCYIAGPLPLKQKHDGEAFAVQHERLLGVFQQLLDRVEAKASGTTEACNRVWRERDRLRAQRDALVAAASSAVNGVVMIRDDCYRDVLVVDPDKIEALRAAIRAAKENQ